MRKTSLYLDVADQARLHRLASVEGKTQAEIVRAALADYEAKRRPDREFALAGAWEGGPEPIDQTALEELLVGFGEADVPGEPAR